MSLTLLKHVWRNVVKSNQLSLTSVHSRALSSSLSEVTKSTPREDPLTSRLQAAPTAGAVLAAVQAGLPGATAQHMLQALRCLFLLHRAGKFEKDTEELIKDPGFSLLCQNFKKHARALDVNEAIEATKVLSYLKVPVDSLIVQTLLQLIRCNINNINVRQIMFLDFILNQYNTKNHLVDALKLALPLAFQVHLPLEMDNEDLPLLRDMLHYCCAHDLPDRCINNVVTGLLLHDQTIDAQAAKSIIWSLCDVNCTEEVFPTRVQLLHICFDILSQSLGRLSYDEVLRTAARLKGRILEKHPEYYHEHLMDAIANYVIEKNIEFEKGLLIARVLSRIAHTHLGLVEYLCQQAVSSPTTLENARTNILFGFINCLANNNYTPQPDQWAEIRRQISNNPVMHAKHAALPWVKVCLELASLGHYEDRLLECVFSQDFLDEFLNRPENKLDHLQLLTLHEAVHAFHSQEYALPAGVLAHARALYPTHALTEQLRDCLARALRAPDAVASDVVLPSGIVAGNVIVQEMALPAGVLAHARALYPTHALTEQLRDCLARALRAPDAVASDVVLPSGIVAGNVIVQEMALPAGVLAHARALYPTHALTEQLRDCLARALRAPDAVASDVVLPSGIVAGNVIVQEMALPAGVLAHARALYPTHALTEQLRDCLARALRAPDAVASDVVLPSGIVADVLVCLHHGYPVPLPRAAGKVPIGEFNLPPGSLPVCIMNFNQGCFSMNSNRLRGPFRLILDVLEASGYAAVAVNAREWLRAPPHERAPYLLRELEHRAGQAGVCVKRPNV